MALVERAHRRHEPDRRRAQRLERVRASAIVRDDASCRHTVGVAAGDAGRRCGEDEVEAPRARALGCGWPRGGARPVSQSPRAIGPGRARSPCPITPRMSGSSASGGAPAASSSEPAAAAERDEVVRRHRRAGVVRRALRRRRARTDGDPRRLARATSPTARASSSLRRHGAPGAVELLGRRDCRRTICSGCSPKRPDVRRRARRAASRR